MKTMTRVQLINWHYFSNEIISFKDINFLTGTNTAGKSTIIDALQVVLCGETRSTYFNRAAGKKSERTFKSYLIGTMGDDIVKGVQSLRGDKDFSSYIVAEFYDDIKNASFCLGMVADVYTDGGDIAKRFFILDDSLPSEKFIENGITVGSKDFIGRAKSEYSERHFRSFDTAEQYRSAVLVKTNVHDNKLFPLLRKAISFEPINNIEQFITENICDADNNINIDEMLDEVRSYQSTENEAENTKLRLEKLEIIHNKYSEIENLRKREKLQNFFVDYAKHCDTKEQLEAKQLQQTELKTKLDNLLSEINSLEQENDNLEHELPGLKKDYERLVKESNRDILELQEKTKTNEIETANAKISELVAKTSAGSKDWVNRCGYALNVLSEEAHISPVEQLQKMLKRISSFKSESLGETSVKYFTDIKAAYTNAYELCLPVYSAVAAELEVKKREKSELEDQIAVLRKGRKNYDRKALLLRDKIKNGLSEQHKKDVGVYFLADMLDITDDEWKNAVEGWLGSQRMNIITAPEYFIDAYKIYKKIKNDVYEYAVVDLERVYNDRPIAKTGSLAEVVSCESKYVRAYIDYLLGNVMRCDDDDKIRDYRTSVTRDCMQYRSYAVKPINPRNYQIPFIGSKSIEIQLKQKEDELLAVEKRIGELANITRSLKPFCTAEWFINEAFIDNTVTSAFEAYNLLPDLRAQLAEIEDKLNKIDDTKINEAAEIIAENEKKQKANADKIGNLNRDVGKLENSIKNALKEIEVLENTLTSLNEVLSTYGETYIEESKPEYKERLIQRKTHTSVHETYSTAVNGTRTLLSDANKNLIDLRDDYNTKFHFSYNISNVENNDEFENEYIRIKDIALPGFIDKIAKAKENAMNRFKSDFLYRLKNNIGEVYEQIGDLNKALRNARFGNDKYEFSIKPNLDYIDYYNMITSEKLDSAEYTLFSYEFEEQYKDTIENLFGQIVGYDKADTEAVEAVQKFSRYSTYLSFDILKLDENGIKEPLSKTITTKSGGEIQTPFYVAMLASFAQIYKVNSTRNQTDNTMRLVIFDEAFNKMDPERISESIEMLRRFELQAIICSPTEKAGDIMPICDRTLLVDKQRDGSVYRSTVIEWTKEMGELN
ncbi:MAG: hypothetical protein HDT42_07780 [Ruminococcaceae bacterium]|nr:hypothetical protein [Oscillospiraceae bacterium]